jgi:hypothetical protein
MAAREAVEALHAELLGEVQELTLHVDQLSKNLPQLLNGVKEDAEAVRSSLEGGVENFKGACLAMAEFIKARKAEVVEDLDKASARNATTLRRSMGGVRKALWAVALLSGVNFVLMAVTLIALARGH